MVKRVCQIIKIRPERLEEYKEIHANAWPSVLSVLERAHFKDYTIHHSPQFDLLIAHFTYVGEDWEGDMRKIAEDPETQRWWKITDGMQETLVKGSTGSGGEKPWWLDLEQVFSFEGSK